MRRLYVTQLITIGIPTLLHKNVTPINTIKNAASKEAVDYTANSLGLTKKLEKLFTLRWAQRL